MKYLAICNDKEREVEVTRVSDHVFRVEIDGDGHIHQVDARFCSADWLSMLVDHASYDISFTADKDDVELNFRNRKYEIILLDERKMRMREVRSQLDMSGPEIIKTSMPGKIVKVLVEPGQKVEAGTGVIIIEAMKMENEIQCRKGGTVKAVHVHVQQTVESGFALVEIEPEHHE